MHPGPIETRQPSASALPPAVPSLRPALSDLLGYRTSFAREGQHPKVSATREWYDAPLTRPLRLRGATEARCAGAPYGQSARQHSSPYGHLADSAASATPPPTATSAAPLPAHKTRACTRGGHRALAAQDTKPIPRPAKSRELRSPGALTPSAGRGKPPRQLTALGRPPGRLTRRLFTTFHSAPLPVGPATSRTPIAPPKRTEAAALPPARAAKPPYRSTALHCVKTAETGDSPASASPVLAPETLASSLASAAAWSCAGPQS